MTDEKPLEHAEPSEELPPGADLEADDPIRALLKGAAKKEPPPAANLLPAVQKKLRDRSRGKFYGDGWSTAQQTTSYLLVAVLMLLVLGAAYYVLGSVK